MEKNKKAFAPVPTGKDKVFFDMEAEAVWVNFTLNPQGEFLEFSELKKVLESVDNLVKALKNLGVTVKDSDLEVDMPSPPGNDGAVVYFFQSGKMPDQEEMEKVATEAGIFLP